MGTLLAIVFHDSTDPTIDHGAPGLPPNLIIEHHQKPLGQSWSPTVPQNPLLEPSTLLPPSPGSPVARDHTFCSQSHRRQGAAVSSPKGKKTKNRAPIAIGAVDRHPT